MKRARVQTASPSPEDLLEKAIAARTSASRARYARRGLSFAGRLDPDIHTMLLRQLYLADYESENFEDAARVAEQMLALGSLPDVCHQDLARALLAQGNIDGAADNLRLAARIGPARRRAFHMWTLGSVLMLAGRLADAEAALQRAVRWGTTDRPLYEGQLALVRGMMGKTVVNATAVMERLEEAPCGQGYGRFVLGMLAHALGESRVAERYLIAFAKRARAGRKAMTLSLAPELALADATLRLLTSN